MGQELRKTKRQRKQEEYVQYQRQRTQELLDEVAQARREAASQPAGHVSDPNRYFMRLAIPVRDGHEADVADFAVYKMGQRLAGVIELYNGYDGYPYSDGTDYLRTYHCNLVADNQRPDEEVRGRILSTLRDLGLESMGIERGEVVRWEYDNWEDNLLTEEELAAKIAASNTRWEAEMEARRAEWKAWAEQRRVEEEALRHERQAQQVKDNQLYKSIQNALALIAPQGQKRVSLHEGVVTVEVCGAESLERLRSLVEQVPGLKVEWLRSRSTKGWTRVRGQVTQYPGDELFTRRKARVRPTGLGGVTDGAPTS